MHEISIAENEMVLMDQDGNTFAVCALGSYRAAKRTVREWAAKYTLDIAAAYAALQQHFSQA